MSVSYNQESPVLKWEKESKLHMSFSLEKKEMLQSTDNNIKNHHCP